MSLHKPTLILISGCDDALLGGTPRAEGSHKRAVLAPEDRQVRVRLVEVVAELGKSELFHLACSSFGRQEGSATRGVGRRPPPGPPARTAAACRPQSARPPPRALLPRNDPPPCRPGPCAALSCGALAPSLACPRVRLAAS